MSRFFHKNNQEPKCQLHERKHGHLYKAWIGLRAGFGPGGWGLLWIRSAHDEENRKKYKEQKYIEHNIPIRKV